MTKTLQDRIIRIFYKEFGYLETPIDFYTGNTYSNPKMKGIEHLDKIAEFIKTSIKEVEEETRKETIGELAKIKGVGVKTIENLLSITNKEIPNE